MDLPLLNNEREDLRNSLNSLIIGLMISAKSSLEIVTSQSVSGVMLSKLNSVSVLDVNFFLIFSI